MMTSNEFGHLSIVVDEASSSLMLFVVKMVSCPSCICFLLWVNEVVVALLVVKEANVNDEEELRCRRLSRSEIWMKNSCSLSLRPGHSLVFLSGMYITIKRSISFLSFKRRLNWVNDDEDDGDIDAKYQLPSKWWWRRITSLLLFCFSYNKRSEGRARNKRQET